MKKVVAFIAILVAIALGVGWQAGYQTSSGMRLDSVGAVVDSAESCVTAAPQTVSATTTQVVAAVSGKKIRVCRIAISRTDTAAVVATGKLVEGTGSNCATGQTSMTGVIAAFGSGLVGNLHVGGSASGAFTTTTASDALCFTEAGAASSMDISLTYIQY